ncbi:hypothetical protein EDC01DRAFT_780252 [Geopyxis carbonaria]|nr:hypothetical protein EDC01DRAFT_780252 [Geopyxis carbonaria]
MATSNTDQQQLRTKTDTDNAGVTAPETSSAPSSNSDSPENGSSSSAAGSSSSATEMDSEHKHKEKDANGASTKEGEVTEGKTSRKSYCVHRKQRAIEREREEKEAKEKEEKEKKEKEAKEAKEAKEKKDQEAKDKKKKKARKAKKSKKRKDDSDSDSSSSSESEAAASDEAEDGESSSSSSSSDSSDDDLGDEALAVAIRMLLAKRSKKGGKKEKAREKKKAKARRKRKAAKKAEEEAEAEAKEKEGEDKERATVLEYKRVDELFDKELHDWDVRDSVPHSKADKYSSFVFTVRRIFDYENRYQETLVDVKSPLLKDALSDVFGDTRGISLIEDIPEVDPNMLFNYYNELKDWVEAAANPAPTDAEKEASKEKEKKKRRRDPLTGADLPPLTDAEKKQQIEHVKLLLEYLDKDFKTTRATLFPLLENKMITFDLLWAVLKPNTIMYTTCAGSNEPRAFKLEYAQMNSSFLRGKWWSVEGRYLECRGEEDNKKNSSGFGWGTVMVDIDAFKGARKIGSLACYPLDHRKDKEEMRAKLIERGRKFVTLRGQQYKAHKGLAFRKKQRQYVKVHVTGRIMIDPTTFRRINPNYVISSVKSRNNDADADEDANYFYMDSDNNSDGEDEDACEDCCCCSGEKDAEEAEEEKQRRAMRFIKDDKGEWQLVSKAEEKEKEGKVEELQIVGVDDEEVAEKDAEPEFEDLDYLIASPVVLGWAFNEKLWLEFPVSTVEEISWNDKAFDSLVLPEDQKDIVRALVESHSASNPNATIDDVITGKGRGLVSVLHGPPGVGKTLTAEGIAELLRRPLYCVSSGELGTNPTQLEAELQKILDIAHSWGAVLLLDEADVFLEKRTFSDMHRNALVSIFLRLLEYFQGILFLTTNRVETFDDAFQSRIHVALRYTELGFKAKVKIWTMFFEMVRKQEGTEKSVFTEENIEWLSRKNLNGRQIKNIVRTAQALAKSKKEQMDMKHIRIVMGVAEGFDNDLHGTGQMDSLHAYA